MNYKKPLRFLPVFSLLVLFSLGQVGCGVKVEEEPAAPPPSPPVPQPTAVEGAPPVRLQQSQAGSVLILEEVVEGDTSPVGAPTPLKRQPPDYDPFQDQHVRLYVRDVDPSLKAATQVALSSGGQVINYPIKGFENMGPHERTLVFDIRTYRPFLKKLQSIGRVEHPEIAPSDFVTVRLTVLREEAPAASRAAPTPAS